MIKEHFKYKGFGTDEDGRFYSKWGLGHDETGNFKRVLLNNWRENSSYCGDNKRVTIRLSVYNKTIRLHRFVWECFNGAIPKGMEIDHKDRNQSHNKPSNLRLATSSEQKKNTGKKLWNGKASSRFKGVCYCKSRQCWQVGIKINGVAKFLGYFENEIDAAKRYDEVAHIHNHTTNKQLNLL